VYVRKGGVEGVVIKSAPPAGGGGGAD